MNAARFFEWTQAHSKAIKLMAIPLLIVMMISIYVIVYFTGGIKYVYSHSMYIPIILAGLIFGIRGGIFAGVLGGFILGPFMPISVVTGEPQELSNWIYRACFFTLIGFLIGAASDSNQKYLARIKWIMNHDVLSNLPNRVALISTMAEIKRTRNAAQSNALALISIDNVMEIESVYGPEAIDEIVNQLAARLKYSLSEEAAIHRTNTHQLSVLLPTSEDNNDEVILSEFANISKQPFTFEDIFIHGDVRIGYAKLSSRDEDPDHYLRKAEIALRAATEQSQNWVFFTPELDNQNTRSNLTLLSELKEALECGQLSLHYQPKVSIASGKIQGVEALMRWHHPTKGRILPDDFIPRAEQSVLADLLTQWTIDTALAQQVQWNNLGLKFPIGVNISPKNLLQPCFVDTVIQLLEKHQVEGKLLELEITEGALMVDIERTIVKLMELSDVNVVISIDDFGTGYSSLQYLNSLPATTIKVDQSFIHKLSENTGSKHIVEAAINLAHGLEMKVVAEGVEDKSTYDYLAGLGCDVAQGYYICHPLSANNFVDWYQSRNGYFASV